LRTMPTQRPLRVYTLDPMRQAGVTSTALVSVPYEPLWRGPVGRRVEVIDFDGARRCFYEPVDLDDPVVALQAGLRPDERDPRFHQQMTYAVAMTVLDRFDRALGRRLRFRTGRLRLFPHAFVGDNAFYRPDIRAVLFGYFRAGSRPGPNLPGQYIFTCLSHDIIAHEVTHAIVHRLRPQYMNVTNVDVRAFNEAVADVVAVFLHFQLEGVLERAIEATRTGLNDASPLVDLAAQFGYARGDDSALRTALRDPDPTALDRSFLPHSRGAIMLAAVFGAFLDTYQRRLAELATLATGGSGILAPGNVDPRLVSELARAARALADRILLLCIRAFDYLPPVDVTFGDFLRALVTADFELFPGDETGVRAAMIDSCRRHGILPAGVASLAEESLRWDQSEPGDIEQLPIDAERVLFDAASLVERRTGSAEGRDPRGEDGRPGWWRRLEGWAQRNHRALGLAPARLQVRHFHTSFRLDEFDQPRVDVVVQVLQRAQEELEASVGARVDGAELWGGATVVADAGGTVRYVISKPTPGQGTPGRDRLEAILGFAANSAAHDLVVPGDEHQRLRLDYSALHTWHDDG
jgi:hypothetical protein